MATSTYYSFRCGPVRLDLVFTAPMLIDDLELLSTPVNYLSYQVTATDGKKHDVQFYFATTPQLAVNEMNQPTVAEQVVSGGMQYLKCGSVEQPVLKRKGDLISIDWGYLYLPAFSGKVALADAERVERIFAKKGRVDAMGNGPVKSQQALSTALVYVDDLGRTAEARRFMLLGYDEVRDIQYMGRDYKGYWARNGKTIFQAFEQMRAQYTEVMQRCRQLDSRIYDDALRAGNKQYAELLAGCYRHVMAAHKLFEDDRGNLLFFSKENNSNGCVNTVDLTSAEGYDALGVRLLQGYLAVGIRRLRCPRPGHLSACQRTGLRHHTTGCRRGIRREYAYRGERQPAHPHSGRVPHRGQHEMAR